MPLYRSARSTGIQHHNTERAVCELCEREKRCTERYDMVACVDCRNTLLP